MPHEKLFVDETEGVACVTLDRPAKMNALDEPMVAELDSVFAGLAGNDSVHAVVLTGAGERAFASGIDLELLGRLSSEEARALSQRVRRLGDRIEALGKPVVAAVNGYALGSGCELALACHMRVAADTAVFGFPEVGLGLACCHGGTRRLPRLVGKGRALELLLTGGRCDATEALRLGLVNKVVFRDRLLDEARTLVRRIVANAPLAVRATLRAVVETLDGPPSAVEAAEADLFAKLYDSDDAKEGIRAFLEKRPARFTAR